MKKKKRIISKKIKLYRKFVPNKLDFFIFKINQLILNYYLAKNSSSSINFIIILKNFL